ncbi:MAG: hypothetical protein CSA21_05915 [Deltaproteobacteria bacterium]|nr:MAG: hypothetical protein CSA21_05915 [Deltaproteobacteria bacterium]
MRRVQYAQGTSVSQRAHAGSASSVYFFGRLVVLLVLTAAACTPTHPLPQPHKVVDPSLVEDAVKTSQWDIAAIRYTYPGQGFDFSQAALEPVFLVFKNIGQSQPKVLLEEMRGMGDDGDYLPYSINEAERLVFASETFRQTAKNTLKSGGLGAFIGGGLGAVISLLTGDNVLAGAGMGAAVGGTAFGVSSLAGAEAGLQRTISQELVRYAWEPSLIPPSFTRMGYIYLPGGKGIDRLAITVRSAQEMATYVLPLLDFPNTVDTAETGEQ